MMLLKNEDSSSQKNSAYESIPNNFQIKQTLNKSNNYK